MSLSKGVLVFRTWVALMAFAGLNFGLSYVPDLGDARIPIALVLAGANASILVLVFMEMKRGTLSLKLTFLTAAALLALLIGLMIADVLLRERPLTPPGTPAPGTADLPSHT